MSVIIKFGALGVLIGLNLSFALEFQLIGGVIIIQILPALVLIANLIVATVLNPLFRRLRDGYDETTPADYETEGPAEPIAVAPEQAHGAT